MRGSRALLPTLEESNCLEVGDLRVHLSVDGDRHRIIRLLLGFDGFAQLHVCADHIWKARPKQHPPRMRPQGCLQACS